MTLNIICSNRTRGHFLRQIIFILSIKLFNWARDAGDTRHAVDTSVWSRHVTSVRTIIRIPPTTIYISTVDNTATTPPPGTGF